MRAWLQAVKHSWHGYESYAWGMDELTPLSRGGKDTFGGLGATLIDSLDTLHMMGLYSDFRRYSASCNQSEHACMLAGSILLPWPWQAP